MDPKPDFARISPEMKVAAGLGVLATLAYALSSRKGWWEAVPIVAILLAINGVGYWRLRQRVAREAEERTLRSGRPAPPPEG